MSWRDQLQPASFRGVRFHVDQHDAQGGRRVASHEYPMRDKPYTEDLGRKQRKYTLQAFVIGDNYMALRNELLQALEQKGPGVLVHPYLGRLSVNIESYSLSESTAKGGMAGLTIQCAESGLRPAPNATIDTQRKLSDACQRLNDANILAFERSLKTKNQLQSVIKKVEDRLAEIAKELQDKQHEIIALLSEPKALAQRIINQVANIAATLQSGAQALERLIKKPVRWPIVHTEAALANQQNSSAFDALINTAVISFLANEAATTQWQSGVDAKAFQTQMLQVIDDQVSHSAPGNYPIDDEVYIALLDVQAALIEDIAERSLKLPNAHYIELASSMPSLVVCFNQYGQLDQEDVLVHRNRVAKPGFMPANQPIEVLL